MCGNLPNSCFPGIYNLPKIKFNANRHLSPSFKFFLFFFLLAKGFSQFPFLSAIPWLYRFASGKMNKSQNNSTVVEGDGAILTWELSKHIDRAIQANRLDIVITDFKEYKRYLIDMIILSDKSISPK